MKAAIEPISGVIRVWMDGGVYGDPYEWVATVRWINRTSVEILGYTRRVTPGIWRAVSKECQKNGIEKVLAVSYHNGKRKEKWLRVPSVFEEIYDG